MNPETNNKTILTDELIERLSDALLLGLYMEQAAHLCGIGESTFHEWVKKGKENAAEFPQCAKLAESVRVAISKCESRDLRQLEINSTGKFRKGETFGDWRAAAWRLERRFPKRWGKKIEVTENDGDKKPQVILILPKNNRERKD